MASILDAPPADVKAEVQRLRASLDAAIPAKRLDQNLVVASWNIRAFGDLTEKWRAEAGDSPRRDLRALKCIAEIVSRFDVIAIQEVRGNIKSLRHMMKALGPDWGFIMTDVTQGKSGNDERMAYVFDTRRVKPSGLAGELVLSEEALAAGASAGSLSRQFARTPYAVSFVSKDETFVLTTLHVIYGASAAGRAVELKAIAEWLADWAKREQSWGHNLIALGDFNIDRKEDPNFVAFTSTGLQPPAELDGLQRTIFDSDQGHFYDQIAWFVDPAKGPVLSLTYSGQAGAFDFVPLIAAESKQALSWQISDHYPLWVDFLVRGE